MDVKEERTLFQKSVLIILAAMIVVFGVVNGFNQTREGILFRDKFLRREEVTDADCFTGKVEGESVTILRWYGGEDGARTITLRVGERIRDTYTVYQGEPMISLNDTISGLQVPTVRITKNDGVIFEGGYQESSGVFFTSDGKFSAVTIDGTMYGSGADPWEDYTVPKSFLMDMVLGPTLVTRGNWGLYALTVLLTVMTMVDVAYPDTLFRWRYRWRVKNPEPTDDYRSMQHLGWVFMTAVLLGFHIAAATTLM